MIICGVVSGFLSLCEGGGRIRVVVEGVVVQEDVEEESGEDLRVASIGF